MASMGIFKLWHSISLLLRTTIIGLACHSGNQDCLFDAAELIQNWTQGQEIPSSLRTLVYHYGMSEIGQEEHWNYMWDKYLAEESPSERKNLLYGLAHVRVPSLIHKYLDYAMDDHKIRRQDFFTVLSYIAGNPVGRASVWNFLREKWYFLVDRFTLNDRYLGLSVKTICRYFTSENKLHQMKNFFAKYPDAGAGKRRRLQALENVQNNIKWLKTNKQGVKAWLQSEGTAPWYYHRLPPHIVPKHYDLLVHPMMDIDKFNGTVAISIFLEKPTDAILVHADKLNVSRKEVRYAEDDRTIEIAETFWYEENDYLVLKFGYKLGVGSYRLYFEFEGSLIVDLNGLYKSSYVDPEKMQTKLLATTYFEAISARKAFPCFDEPMFKTTFTVRVIHDSEHFALSNAEVKEIIKLENGLLETRFKETVPMVSYLVAIVVSDFKYKETTTQNGVKLSVYAAPHHMKKIDYSLDCGSKILTYFENYFDVPYPLSKLDMIAIPDFEKRGMENWGLITYSEKFLLFDDASSIEHKMHTISLVAHELAHLWFGDLVTMVWWDELWLNEGFATFVSRKGIHHVEPTFDPEDNGLVESLITAMSKDNTVGSHAIVQQVTYVLSGIFDSKTYAKGATILRMLEKYMGEDFRKGVSTYLKKYSFNNTVTEDLWAELTAASTQGLNVSNIMGTWTRQMNYPYVNVKKEPSENGGHFAISQHRYLRDPDTVKYSAEISPYNYVWQIPMSYRISNSEEIHYMLLNSSEAEVVMDIPDSEWIKFNVNFTGYYSVNYDLQNWNKFIDVLKNEHEVLSPTDRVNLLYDSFTLAIAGHLDYGIPLNMTTYMKKEKFHGAWNVVISKLMEIKAYFKNERKVEDIVKEYTRSLTKDLLREYGWEDKGNYSEKQLRHLIIDASCSSGNHECLLTAGNLFKQHMNGKKLNSEVRGLVYKYGLRVMNNEDAWNFVWNRFLNETDPNIKSEYSDALSSVRNSTMLERFMNLAKNSSLVRNHNYFTVLDVIAQNQKGFPLVTSLIYKSFDELVERYGSSRTETFVQGIFKQYDTEKDLKKVRDFYQKKKPTKESHTARKLAIETIMINIKWQTMHRESVKKWFNHNVYMPLKNI